MIIVVGVRRNKQLADISTAPRGAPQLESMLKVENMKRTSMSILVSMTV